MTRYLVRAECCPPVDVFTGGKKPIRCRHGERYVTEKQIRGTVRVVEVGGRKLDHDKPRRKPMRHREPKRDWTLALAKKEEEGDVCRVTGESGTELAHILGRKYDEPISPGSRTLLVLPDRVVPLAPRIHRAYDAHEIDLLPYLTAAEQAQAVLDAGSMGLALRRISPTLELAA